MNIRIGFSVIYAVLIAGLVFCSVKSFLSHKSIAQAVGLLELALIPPLTGNLIIIASQVEEISLVGCYVYFVGVDLVMLALLRFTTEYCSGIGRGQQAPIIMYFFPAADAIQLLFNPFFGHAFSIEKIIVQGLPYYRLVPHFGQVVHRIVDYTILLSVVLIFTVATLRAAKIYRERYSVILLSIIIVAVWETFYIFSRTPVDRSMIGFGVCGLLVFYFSLYYRPLRLLDRMLSDIATNMTEALFVYDSMGRCIWANETGLKLVKLNDTQLENVSSALINKFGRQKFTSADWTEDIVLGSGDSASYYTLENHAVNEDKKHLAGSYLVVRDNTEEKRRIKREIYNSTHDSLTQLFTKQYLFECIRKILNKNKDTAYTAIFIDVKNFKIVNDIFSTAFGDIALQQIADWIRKNMNGKCVYGRLVGDTFGVFMPSELFETKKEEIEKDLLNFVVSDGNVEHRLLIQMGVYEVSDRDINVSVMFDRAHFALSTLTDNYKKHIAYYDQNLRDKVFWDQQITAELNEALETMQIRPYLQPIMDRTGKVVGAEALARWIHPERGFMSPGTFIPVFEKNSLIIEVDRHIWRCACEILSDWKETHGDTFISINISPKDLYFIDIVSEITGLVKEYSIDPKNLRIEITETVMITDVQGGFKMLAELRKAGFIVEMDDFGSGYSSLNLLKDMPVDVLKIDMKFLSDSDNSPKAQTIIRNIIKLSDELDIVSLTEGVETKQQYSQLSDVGCKLFQGYYFAKPMPKEEFEEFAFAAVNTK